MKKWFFVLIFGTLLVCLHLPGIALPVYAAPARVMTPARQAAPAVVQRRENRAHSPAWWHFPRGYPSIQEINQVHRGDGNYHIFLNPVGHDQNNTGNHGHNRGHNQDNSVNSGNQLSQLQRLGGYRRINQYFYGNSDYDNKIISNGYNQSNTGNNGLNDGFNQDNSVNNGNQIIN